MPPKSYAETALRLLKLLPRVGLNNLVRNPYLGPLVSKSWLDNIVIVLCSFGHEEDSEFWVVNSAMVRKELFKEEHLAHPDMMASQHRSF